jgi:hypothetical protein
MVNNDGPPDGHLNRRLLGSLITFYSVTILSCRRHHIPYHMHTRLSSIDIYHLQHSIIYPRQCVRCDLPMPPRLSHSGQRSKDRPCRLEVLALDLGPANA